VEILVLHPGGLGDIILSFPAIALLRKQSPAARITIAANIDHLAPIAAGYADSVISLSAIPLHQLYTPASSFEANDQYWKSFDRIISWTGFGDDNFTNNLKSIHSDCIIGRWRPEPNESKHVSELFIDTLGLGSSQNNAKPHILLNAKLRQAGLQWLRDNGWNGFSQLIVLHPGSGSEKKRWPLSGFIELAQRLANRECSLLIVEGPAEEGLAGSIADQLAPAKCIMARSLPLDLLSAAIQRCLAYVGNDSGLTHLAAALNVPVIALFGPTNPNHWAPLGNNVTVLHKPEGCSACAYKGPEHTCLLNITVENVLDLCSFK
jgi:ADP-heptose:LPS heptosyltransferase